MTTDSFFALMCGGMIALLFGLVLAFAGYRLFLVLLPIWGFFFGFGLGAQSIQALFGDAFLATITSWVVGFVVGAIFAVLMTSGPLVVFAGCRERHPHRVVRRLSLLEGFRLVLHNRPFSLALSMYLAAWVALSMTTGMFVFFFGYWLHFGDQLKYVLPVTFLTAAAMLPMSADGRSHNTSIHRNGLFGSRSRQLSRSPGADPCRIHSVRSTTGILPLAANP